MVSYIFGPDQQYKTPAELAKARAVANAILMNQGAPKNVGEGLSAIGQALLFRSMMGKADASEAAGKTAADAAFNPVLAALGGPKAFPAAPGSSKVAAALTGKQKDDIAFPNSMTADSDLAPEQKALLDTIAGPESRGAYDVMYGGGRIADLSDHPRTPVLITSGPNKGKYSTAAGKYQFLGSTWDDQAKKLGLTDFKPGSQDKAAWNLAAETYKEKTGQDLDAVLQSGDPDAIAGVGQALSGQWTSLPGGIEQGTNTNRFVSAFQQNLGGNRAPAVAAINQMAGAPTQVASLDPSAGMASAAGAPDPYGQIPAVDGMGQDQRAKFRQWNSNPVANEAANEASVDPALAGVIQRAKQIAGTDFVIGSGKRDAAMQKKAVQWGWSKTEDSDHLGGGAADLWPVNADGQVVFDPKKQAQIVAAMKQAAGEMGVDLEAGADWKRFKDTPHFGMIGQTPMQGPIPTADPRQSQPQQVASADPSIGLPSQGTPQPGEVGGPEATTPAGQRVLAALMNPQPMAGGQAPMPMQGPQGGQPVPPPPQAQATPTASPIAQALFGKPAAPQPQMTAQTDPSMVPAAAGGTADTFNASQGPNLQQLYGALQQPFLTDTQRSIIETEIQRQQQEADPLRQLQLQKARRDLTNPQKNWQRLDDTHLFDPESGEIKAADGGASNGKFRFKGSSVEAQGLNGLMDAGKITEDQAQQLAAGKTITDPTTGAIIFMTPQGVFGQSPQGGQPQPVFPTPQAMPPQAQPQGAPIPPPAPNAGQQQAPAVAPPAAVPGDQQRQGMIPLTDGKPAKPPTEQQVRNQQLYQVAAPELKIVEDNFGALSNLSDQAWSAIPGSDNYGANYMQTGEYQRANNSLKTIIATYLYSTSGATANPGEVANQAAVLMPKPGEDPTSVADKLARVRVMVNSIKTAGGGSGQPGADPKAALKQKYGLD